MGHFVHMVLFQQHLQYIWKRLLKLPRPNHLYLAYIIDHFEVYHCIPREMSMEYKNFIICVFIEISNNLCWLNSKPVGLIERIT